MKGYSIFDYFGYAIPMKERYKLIHNAGFDFVSLSWMGYPDNPSETKHLNPDLAREAGLMIDNIHTPFEGANELWIDKLQGEDYANTQIACIRDCARYNIKTMVLHISQGANQPDTSWIGINRLNHIVEEAEKQNVDLAFENMREPKHLKYIIDNIQSDRVKFCFDSGHQHCRTPDEDYITLFKNNIAAIHLHDNDGRSDQHNLPFDGTLKWATVINKLRTSGYSGPIGFEVINNRYKHLSAYEFLKLAYERADMLSKI